MLQCQVLCLNQVRTIIDGDKDSGTWSKKLDSPEKRKCNTLLVVLVSAIIAGKLRFTKRLGLYPHTFKKKVTLSTLTNKKFDKSGTFCGS